MYPINPDLKLSEAVYNTDQFSSIKTLKSLRDAKPDVINSLVTYAYGSDSKYRSVNFPLMFYTQGMGRKRSIKSPDGKFEARMYGNPKKTSRVARELTYGGGKPGLGGIQTFTIVFEDRWFMKGQILYSGNYGNLQVRVETNPVEDPKGGWAYTVRLQGAKADSFIPLSALKKGVEWAGGVVKTSLLRSKGTEHRSQTHYRMANQISMIRHSFNYAGNIANKTMNFAIKTDKGTINLWTEWEKYQEELALQEKKEVDFIFSKMNADANGVIQTIDVDSNEVVPSGMGIWDQITQSLEYGVMTEAKLDNFIQDIIYNNGETTKGANEERVIIGGTGLIMEIDRAFKNRVNGFTLIASDLYTKDKGGDGMQFGGYFTSYKHRSGVIFKFVTHKAFDSSPIAKAAPRHPKYKSMSSMSFCGMALDFAMVDVDRKLTGKDQESNIMFLYEEGREYEEWIVAGGAKMPGKSMPEFRATDQDQSSSHMMCTQGAHVNYPGLCAKILFKG